ncbi:MAG: zinc-binding dehydrogenase [Haloferacaceae archaeon]
MRAVVCTDFDESRVEEVERPTPAPDEVLLGVRRVQFSVTECNLYRGNRIAHYDQVAPRLADGPARLFGHEFCADVVEAGGDVDDLAVGDRVYASGKIPCGSCAYCAAGFVLECEDKTYLGYDRPGAAAEYFTSPTAPLTRLPDGVSDLEGAAMQPLASAVLCVHDADVTTGDTVAVIGAGVMGHQVAQLALQQGAAEVHVVDVDPEKLDIAADNGLGSIDATGTDPVAEVRDRTGGVGADVVVEAVGGEQDAMCEGDDPLAQAVRMARTGATLLQVGHVIGDVAVRPRTLRSKDLDWVFPRKGAAHLSPVGHTGAYAARLVADGRVSIAEYVTHELDGLENFERAIDVTLNKPDYDALGPAQLVLDR